MQSNAPRAVPLHVRSGGAGAFAGPASLPYAGKGAFEGAKTSRENAPAGAAAPRFRYAKSPTSTPNALTGGEQVCSMREVDYVVVGSGSAGAVIAARLSEDRDVSVLLLEAGPPDRSPILHLPAAARYAFNARRFNWSYESEPEPHLNGRRVKQPRGRVLGGSSSINGLVYLRGHALDYEGWAAAGATGWDYAGVLPYFQKLETRADYSNPYQGDRGPVHVSTAARPNPISHAFIEASRQAGYAFSKDVNGYRQEGCGWFPMNAARGLRWSVARAYLYGARRRANLDVQCGGHADRIEFEGRRAAAVAWRRGSRRHRVRARREIVLSAGAFNSPKLLMLSGIGAGDALKAHGIPVVQELPGVGANLMDHPLTAIQVACRQPVSLAGKLGRGAKVQGSVALARTQGRTARRQPFRVRRVHPQRGGSRVPRRPALPVSHRGRGRQP